MVPAIEQKVTIEDYFPHTQAKEAESHTDTATHEVGKSPNGNTPSVVVSKDFILGLLSLAIGKPYFLDSSVGQKIDLKI